MSIDISTKYPEKQPEFLAFSQNAVKCITNNSYLPSPPITAIVLGQLVGAYQTAQTAAETKAKGTAKVRDDKRKKVEGALDINAVYVQGVVRDAPPTDQQTILASSGYKEKGSGKHDKPEYEIARGTVAGTATAHVKALGRTGSVQYFHQVSFDGGKTWQDGMPTTKAQYTFTGLPVGQTVRFRFRAIIKGAYSDWSQELQYIVT
jgi:hypothetical protein